MKIFRLVKNKNNKPYKYSIKYQHSVILHFPDYLPNKLIKEITERLNKNSTPFKNFDW